MRLYTPSKNQGQIVIVSYGYDNGKAYCRTFDQSDRTETWQCGDIDWIHEHHGIDYEKEPCVECWEDCEKPEDIN